MAFVDEYGKALQEKLQKYLNPDLAGLIAKSTQSPLEKLLAEGFQLTEPLSGYKDRIDYKWARMYLRDLLHYDILCAGECKACSGLATEIEYDEVVLQIGGRQVAMRDFYCSVIILPKCITKEVNTQFFQTLPYRDKDLNQIAVVGTRATRGAIIEQLIAVFESRKLENNHRWQYMQFRYQFECGVESETGPTPMPIEDYNELKAEVKKYTALMDTISDIRTVRMSHSSLVPKYILDGQLTLELADKEKLLVAMHELIAKLEEFQANLLKGIPSDTKGVPDEDEWSEDSEDEEELSVKTFDKTLQLYIVSGKNIILKRVRDGEFIVVGSNLDGKLVPKLTARERRFCDDKNLPVNANVTKR